VSINLSILSAGVVEARQSLGSRYKRECRGVAESTKLSDEGARETGGGG
jgi:hypothetical protein